MSKKALISKEVTEKMYETLKAFRDEFAELCKEQGIVDYDDKNPSLNIFLSDGYVSFFSLISDPSDDDNTAYVVNYTRFDDEDEEEEV